MKCINFRRQHALGNYVTDFCAPKAKLIIELDGSVHVEQCEYDAERTEYFIMQGYKVLRFWNSQVMNDIEEGIYAIVLALELNSQSN
jgi:very-short-patch-repair endonuclease